MTVNEEPPFGGFCLLRCGCGVGFELSRPFSH
jgi:hypothetical protein